ncbi:histidinol-phosphate transaminase [Pararhodonellum marinum]|uniref:histidinol-phosphate transaminase n=1 Tax=Pararhodonellum marinum TaxID=2755358 RepID=UPI0018902956|nr:histidinol-phosphate transaminase [Pararhodonellum marinum]
MAFQLDKLLRPHILKLKPYSSARDEYSGKEGVFLDANENPFGSITAAAYNRYPDPYQRDLKVKIGLVKNIDSEQIFVGNGSDEAIDLLFRAFCQPGKDNVILLPPTYGMYEVSAGINDVATKKVNLSPDFQMDPNAVLSAVDAETKMIFICSPNNPSGNKLERSAIRQVVEGFEGLVVIDEAYIDFSDEPSFIEELNRYPNLVIMQTFSKAWGLAGLRLGLAFASPELIHILNLIKPPYNINQLSQELVAEALQDVAKKEKMVKDILEERDYLLKALTKLPLVQKIYPSHANFLLVKLPEPKAMYAYLISKKVIVRDRSKVVHGEGCLRISVGTRSENELLLQAMAAFPNPIANK